MSIKLSFDPSGNIEIPTLIIVKRNGDIIGNIQNVQNFVCSDSMEDSNEISFDVDYVGCEVWDELKDWRIVWIPDWNTCYKLHVDLNESSKKTKVLTATHLAEYELSHRNLDEVYINDFTEYDSDPTPTIFFDETKPDYSMIHRLLNGTTYIIEHVDESLKRIQRTFNFTDTSIHSAFQEIAEEINCYFEFDVKRNSDGKFVRTVSAYDLYSYCPNCGHRDEFEGVCPKCGNTEYIINGYGEDADIFLSVDNFVDENAYSTNCEEIKTCFKLEAGDDDMTAAVINQNPNGTNLLWSIPEEFVSDMSEELRGKISEYNEQYDYYYNDYVPNVNASAFNSLVNKYKNYNDELYVIGNLKGFPQLTEAYYQTIDMAGYLEHALMPTIQTSETSAEQQGKLLTSESLSPISVEKLESISVSSASNAVVGMAKVIIDSRYQVKEDSGATLSDDKKTWTGKLIVTTYSDEDDKYTTDTLKVTINENYEEFTKQKIEKALKKGDTENYSITSLFKKDDNAFKNMLKQYALVPLRDSILESCNTCINILIDNGVGEPSTWENETEDLYKKLYIPYTNKLTYIQEEIKVRDAELNTVNDLKKEIEKIRRDVQRALDFKDFLGIELYNEFSVFQIDDTYSNPNFISTGLSESEIFEYAKEFYEVAQKEIKKASTIKHIISSTVKNIFIMKEFDKWRNKFSIGNWIRIEVNDVIYKLRLLSYEVDFQDYEQSSVNFSDGTVIHNDANIINNTMKAVQSIQASYGTTKNKADNADGVKKVVDGWSLKGMSTATVKLMNDADNQNVVYDQHGLVLRRMDDFTGEYEGIQCKIINSTIAFTTDGWKTVRTAIGRFFYYDPEDDSLKEGYGINAELLVGRMILGEQMGLYNSGGTLKFDQNGLVVTDGKNTFSVNPNNNTNQGNLLVINNGTENVFYVDKNGVLHIKGDGAGLDLNLTSNGDFNSLSSQVDKNTANISINADNLSIEYKRATDAEGVLSSRINANAEAIELKASRIELEGYVTFSSLTQSGQTEINGANILTGTVTANQIDVNSIFAQDITAEGSITGAKIYGGLGDFTGTINATGGSIAGWSIVGNSLFNNNISLYSFSNDHNGYITINGINTYILLENNRIAFYPSKITSTYYAAFESMESTDGTSIGADISLGTANLSSGSVSTKILISGNFGFISIDGESPIRTWHNNYHFDIEHNDSFLDFIVGQSVTNLNPIRINKENGFIYLNNIGIPILSANVAIRPLHDATFSAGNSDHRFTNIYATNGTIQTSDEREKDIYKIVDDRYEKLFLSLKPIEYRWKYGRDKRIRLGLGAQSTELEMLALEMPVDDMSMIQHDYLENISNGMMDRYGIDYQQINMLTMIMTQKNTRNIIEYKKELNDIKNKLDSILEKINEMENN